MMIKRIVPVLTAVVMAASCALPVSADIHKPVQHQTAAIGGRVKFGSIFSYRVNPDGESVSLIEFTDKAIKEGTLRLPKKLDGKEVTVLSDELGESFCEYYKDIRVVDLSSTITTIEDGAIPDWVDGDAVQPVFTADFFSMNCYRNSAGEKYAVEKGYKYKIKDAAKNDVPTVRFLKSCAIGKSAVKIKWSKVSKVTGYRLYRYYNNKWNKVADLKPDTTSYRDAKCEKYGENLYTIRAFRKSGKKTYWSKKCTVKYIGCMPSSAPAISKAQGIIVKGAENSNRIDIAVKNNGYKSCELMIEVQDPDTGLWSAPVLTPQAEKGATTYSLDGYDISADGHCFRDHFDAGSTYNIRVKFCRMIGDSSYWRNGDLYTSMFHYVYSKPVTRTVKL